MHCTALLGLTAGTEVQIPITLIYGFSAKQLLLTFSGQGLFRLLGERKWTVLKPRLILYIPAGVPNEYRPEADHVWEVGYVTFDESQLGLDHWGFSNTAYLHLVLDTSSYFHYIHRIWTNLGIQSDSWEAARLLFSMLLDLKKEISLHRAEHSSLSIDDIKTAHSTIVESAFRFIHDLLPFELGKPALPICRMGNLFNYGQCFHN
ncbi:hypothetical protein [Paenibacillus paridis]|uniref:hypothetical protein n=1 Tax=Paenibacillus paridis TaxID=2583376 RepID=UPI00112406A7|nr:hypothetical protein [Paenibacillus paridis]